MGSFSLGEKTDRGSRSVKQAYVSLDRLAYWLLLPPKSDNEFTNNIVRLGWGGLTFTIEYLSILG